MNKGGGWGWLGLAAYVAAYDYWTIRTNRETLSSAFGRSMRHPVARIGTVAVTIQLLKHLLFPNWHPELDPLRLAAERLRQAEIEVVEAMNE
jgi:hypothetical protein